MKAEENIINDLRAELACIKDQLVRSNNLLLAADDYGRQLESELEELRENVKKFIAIVIETESDAKSFVIRGKTERTAFDDLRAAVETDQSGHKTSKEDAEQGLKALDDALDAFAGRDGLNKNGA